MGNMKKINIKNRTYYFFKWHDQYWKLCKKYTELWHGIKYHIKTINGGKIIEYGNHENQIQFRW